MHKNIFVLLTTLLFSLFATFSFAISPGAGQAQIRNNMQSIQQNKEAVKQMQQQKQYLQQKQQMQQQQNMQRQQQ